ncbi:hypothetical protein C1646_766604 [Rhizophagus diaphanus]|nr:hypothetical protein C1646_766604 [Rhizophagus diaphanus] [Rhizophagus sp. MUCL 43196]
MEQKYINIDTFEQIKIFHLLLNYQLSIFYSSVKFQYLKLKEHYKENGLCKELENSDIDKLIQESQFNAINPYEKLEWTEHAW